MAIEIFKLFKKYRKAKSNKPAINNLNLKIDTGEVFGFLGPNGAGKSTVIKIIMDFIRPTSGKVTINGQRVEEPKIRRYLGYLPENPFFYDHLTAQEILNFGGKAAHMNKKDIIKRSDDLLERLKLSHVKNNRLRTYSKGMVQRTGLALALIHRPDICILDEPMSGLDPIGRRMIADLILEMRKNGQTVFFSSHILSDIEKVCDRVGILNRGQLLYCGDVKDILSSYGGLEKAFIEMIERDEVDANGANLVSR